MKLYINEKYYGMPVAIKEELQKSVIWFQLPFDDIHVTRWIKVAGIKTYNISEIYKRIEIETY